MADEEGVPPAVLEGADPEEALAAAGADDAEIAAEEPQEHADAGLASDDDEDDEDEDEVDNGLASEEDEDEEEEEVPQAKGKAKAKEGGEKRKRKSGKGKNAKAAPVPVKRPRREPKAAETSQGKSAAEKVIDQLGDDDDAGGVGNADDANFIDDEGVAEEDRETAYAHGDGGEEIHFDEAEEAGSDEEMEDAPKKKKKKKRKGELSQQALSALAATTAAKMAQAAEEDIRLNRAGKPAINKVRMLKEVSIILDRVDLYRDFFAPGSQMMNVLRQWIEPLPDGSLPSLDVRTVILRALTRMPIDSELDEIRMQLKQSGLGKIVLFLYKSEEEIPSNRKLAQSLVERWMRPIFRLSNQYQDLQRVQAQDADRRRDEERRARQKRAKVAAVHATGDDLDDGRGKASTDNFKFHARVPEAAALDYAVRPKPEISQEQAKARHKEKSDHEKKKAAALKRKAAGGGGKNSRAMGVSIEGRGLVTYNQ